MATPYVGEIMIFGGNFAPRGYALCNGQIMSISQNAALFSILGTNFGGNGQSTFGLPNFAGSVPVHQGQGIGLSQYSVGEATGTPSVTLLLSEIPSHNHLVKAATATVASQKTPVPSASAYMGDSGPGAAYASTTTPVAPFNTLGVSFVGGNGSHTNVQPILPLTFCVALTGRFPARN